MIRIWTIGPITVFHELSRWGGGGGGVEELIKERLSIIITENGRLNHVTLIFLRLLFGYLCLPFNRPLEASRFKNWAAFSDGHFPKAADFRRCSDDACPILRASSGGGVSVSVW